MLLTIGSLLSLACLAFLVAYVAIQLAVKWKKDRRAGVAYLRGFKKGQCGIVYLIAIFLYWLGYWHNGEGAFYAFFSAIAEAINLVVLKYSVKNIASVLAAEPVYAVAVYSCFVVVFFNAVLLAVSLGMQNIWCRYHQITMQCSRKPRLILVGNNKENSMVYHSTAQRHKLLLCSAQGSDSGRLAKEKGELYMDRVVYQFTYSLEQELQKQIRAALRPGRECVIILNTGDDKQNMSLCRAAIDQIQALPQQDRDRLFDQLKLFVFGDPRYEAIYADIVRSGFGCLRYTNKHWMVAMDMVQRYPFTKFMDETQIDYQTSLVRPEVEINAILVGFGKTNQQIFLTSVANNQFLTGTPEDPRVKPVNYYIFDKASAENNKNLNHSYYRYRNECCDAEGNFIRPAAQFLPPPELPAREAYFHLDINDRSFYEQLRAIVSRDRRDANFLVIAFGTDLENLDFAQKLTEKCKEWGLPNLTIFVKIRAWRKEYTFLEDRHCHFIGHEADAVFHIQKILGDDLYRMAKMRNQIYDLEYTLTTCGLTAGTAQQVAENREKANRAWYTQKSQMERESSLYCCLSLRSKLNLMGLDYCKAAETSLPGLDQQAYWRHYAGHDLPDTQRYQAFAEDKPVIGYGLDFPVSRRRTMAIHEHQRWNAFMISKGMIPASLEQILEEKTLVNGKQKHTNGKHYALRRHGNLTTFDGLVQFRQLLAQRDGAAEEEKDVIKYDYQLLDDAYWLLTKTGHKIIPHEKL